MDEGEHTTDPIAGFAGKAKGPRCRVPGCHQPTVLGVTVTVRTRGTRSPGSILETRSRTLCAEHGCEPILWGRWKDKDAAEAMRRFMEGGGIAAVEAAGLSKTQGGGVV